MKLRNLRLTLANVARTTNAKTMAVNEVGTVRKFDENGVPTDEITAYTATCSAYRGDELKVKFPPTVKDKWEELQQKLRNDVEIEISFVNLKLTPYALEGKAGGIISGVSGKADDFEIHVSKMDDILLDDEVVM